MLMLRAGSAATVIMNTEITEIFDDTDFAYYIVSQLESLPFHDTEISLSDVESFLQSRAVANEISVVAGRYTRAFTRGDMDYYLTTDDIFEIAQNMDEQLYDLFNHNLTEDDYRLFAQRIDDIMDFGGLTVGDIVYDIGNDFGIGSTMLYLVVSPFLLVITGIICAVILVLMYMRSRGKGVNAFLSACIPISLSGFVYLVAGVVLGYFPHLLGDRLYRFARFADGVAVLVIRYGLGLIGIGLLTGAVMYVLARRVVSC